MPLVFQFGSNCHSPRLNDARRLGGKAQSLGLAQTEERYELTFNKFSTTNGCAAADLVKPRKGGRQIWGVIYEVTNADLKKLRKIEGGAYRQQRIRIVGRRERVWTFRVRQR